MTISHFRGPFAFLSNFYHTRVMVDGMQYPTVEHGYQAAKTLNLRERAMVAAARSPSAAKNMGAMITLRKDWEGVKLDVMRSLLRAKFKQIGVRAMLLATGDEELIESNTWGDTYWGVCRGTGDNNLGKLLMEVRTGYRSGTYS